MHGMFLSGGTGIANRHDSAQPFIGALVVALPAHLPRGADERSPATATTSVISARWLALAKR
jgi:hypothetical protein